MRNNYEDFSKRRLENNLKEKFETIIIGSLSTFEEIFGHLWGHGIDYNKLSSEQKEFRDMWKDVRTTILDKGNSKARAAINELGQYSVSWNRYITNFTIGDKDNGGSK
jgi:hypothetical protein